MTPNLSGSFFSKRRPFLEIATTSIILFLQSSFHTNMISIGHSFENDTHLKTRHIRLETAFVVQSHIVQCDEQSKLTDKLVPNR